MAAWLRNPVFALGFFTALALLLYRWAGSISARGGQGASRQLPYACGQDLTPTDERLSYKVFFRLALMFIVVHIAALISMMLPLMAAEPLAGSIYLVGTGICVDILTRGGD